MHICTDSNRDEVWIDFQSRKTLSLPTRRKHRIGFERAIFPTSFRAMTNRST
jgi:hypothetical protein